MCELFGMSARFPTDVNRSLALLRPRGGEIGPHADGWGLAFYEGRAARVFKEPVPAAESRCLAFISEYDFRSATVIAHIRRANPPEIGRAPANTHPFERELGGRSWVFAHNGKQTGIRGDERFALRHFHPLGETDSEHAFCFLLDRLAEGLGESLAEPTAPALRRILAEPVSELTEMGEFNFLLSDGRHLVANAHTRLHLLHRSCEEQHCAQAVTLLATTPLTEEPWTPLAPATLHLFTAGEEVRSATTASRSLAS
jgi:glutamine amidotransferase